MHRSKSHTIMPKNVANTYYINIGKISQNVSKQHFLQTFQISNDRLERALKRGRISCPGEDLRGKHEPVNKTSEEKMQHVNDHINNVPSYQSQCARSHNPNRKYLHSNLNLRLMYNLYKEKCVDENTSFVTEGVYRSRV
ncbi:exosome complex component [Holotrichia oblita]|uniref:Exosome complex component n=1 Tax=Holotrichia oblita TaxID=644536 RepID=A0ACB9TND8_HOLOL|nr:exosome complex component [Holotrichia oblita]